MSTGSHDSSLKGGGRPMIKDVSDASTFTQLARAGGLVDGLSSTKSRLQELISKASANQPNWRGRTPPSVSLCQASQQSTSTMSRQLGRSTQAKPFSSCAARYMEGSLHHVHRHYHIRVCLARGRALCGEKAPNKVWQALRFLCRT